MHRPEPWQVIYINVPPQSYAVQSDAMPEEEPTFWENVYRFFSEFIS
jgi:hypothetical protein